MDSSPFDRSVESYGGYSYVSYKFSREWSAGFLFDYLQARKTRGTVLSLTLRS